MQEDAIKLQFLLGILGYIPLDLGLECGWGDRW